MNPNTGQPIQDPVAKSNNPTPEQAVIKNEQELQQLEQGLGDIFGDDEGEATPTNTPITPLSTTIPVPTQVSTSASETLSAPETSSVESAPVVSEIPAVISHPINTDPTTLQYSANQTDVSSPIPTSTQVLEPNPASVAVTNVIHPTIEQQLTPTPITQPVTQVIPQEPQIQQLVQEIQPSPVQQIQNPPIAQTPTEVLIPVSPRSPEISSQQIPAPVAGNPEQVASVQAGAVAQPPTTTAANFPPVQKSGTTPPPVIVKKGSKISPLKFAIGCGIFGFVLIGGIGFLLFLALQNPTQFQGIIGIEGIKTGLKLFAGLFFGLLFLGSFVLIIFNLYKLITQKIGSKVKYVIGLIFGAFLLGSTVFGGIVSFNKINEIIETTGINNSLLLPYIKFKDEYKPISDGYTIIAPTKILYKANEILLMRFLNNQFVNKNIQSLKLDCGNDKQILDYNSAEKRFVGECLYMKKGDYTIKFITSIIDPNTDVKEDVISEVGPLNIKTEISLIPTSGTLTSNDANDEIIIGKAPTKINFDSTSIFTDLSLSDYKIEWDLDGDGTPDKKDLTNFSRQFREPKVQSIYYTLPGVNNLVYQIDLRVLQNDVPICTITNDATMGGNTSYTISTTFDEQQTRINSYMYKIKNLGTNKVIETFTNKTTSFDYDFSSQGNYVVYLTYVTEDGKQGNCESDTIEVGASTFNVNYTLQYKGPNDNTRKPLTNTGAVSLTDMNISATTLPVKLMLTINSVTPQSASTKTIVKLDNQIIQTPNGKSYEITLTNSTNNNITITVNNPVTQATTLLEFPIKITQEDIIGRLNVFPNSAGTSPWDVVLDASTTTLTDKDDEIIYFTWDYDDGEIIKNSSQARTDHTYIYDDKTENGEYNPTVTITTKKGKVAKFGLTNPILVKKPIINASISIDSHPAQIATVGDKVDFSLHTDGTPTHIVWDFGTSEGIECSDRSCATVPMFFTTPGTYTISVTITYKDLNSSTATTKLVVEA